MGSWTLGSRKYHTNEIVIICLIRPFKHAVMGELGSVMCILVKGLLTLTSQL